MSKVRQKRHTNKRHTKIGAKETSIITPQQRAIIELLNLENEYLHEVRNSGAAFFISTLMAPSISYYFCKLPPIKSIRDKYYKRLFEETRDVAKNVYDNDFLLDEIQQIYKRYQKLVNSLCHTENESDQINLIQVLGNCFNKLEDSIHSNSLKNIIKKYLSRANELKQFADINTIISRFASYRLRQLHEIIELMDAKIPIPSMLTIKQHLEKVHEYSSIRSMLSIGMIGSPAVLLTDRMLIRPLLSKLLPNKNSEPHKPIYLLTENEATKQIKQLTNYSNNYSLQIIAMISSIFLMTIMLPVLTYFDSGALPFSLSLISPILLNVALYAVSMLIAITKTIYNQIVLHRNLDEQINHLSKIFERYNVDIKKVTNSSRFTKNVFSISFASYKSIVSNQKLAQAMCASLTHENIEVLSYSRTTILLKANTSLNSATAARIKKSFGCHVEALEEISRLKGQINKIMQICKTRSPSFLYDTHYDENTLPSINVEFYLPKIIGLDYKAKLTSLFAMNNVLVKNLDSEIRVNVDGRKPCTDEVLNQFITSVNQQLKIQNTSRTNKCASSSSFFVNSKSSNTFPRHKSNKPKSKVLKEDKGKQKENYKSTSSAQTIFHKKISWSSGCFDSNSEDNSIVPIMHRGRTDYRRFCLFSTPADQFPDNDTYNSFKEILEHPKIAPPKGNKGLVSCIKLIKDPTTKRYTTSMLKAKALGVGKKGDLRVYSTKEVSSTGETLYNFCVVDCKPHR